MPYWHRTPWRFLLRRRLPSNPYCLRAERCRMPELAEWTHSWQWSGQSRDRVRLHALYVLVETRTCGSVAMQLRHLRETKRLGYAAMCIASSIVEINEVALKGFLSK